MAEEEALCRGADEKMKTEFNAFIDDWKRVKNHCRTTDNKDFTEKDPTDTFKKKLLISEHSPIRLLEFDWSWKGIPYWVATHWVRHKFEKFQSTQRTDRTGHDRTKNPQDEPVNLDGYANMQNLIDAWRKRLCYCASKETREYAEDFKAELHKTHPLESDVLVPNCVYRGGCPEFKTCGFWNVFVNTFAEEDIVRDIQWRYDMYNQIFYNGLKNKEKDEGQI